MAAGRATEGGALRTLRSTNPSTARPRAVDGTCDFRTLPITGKSLGRVEQSRHITDARRLPLVKTHCGANDSQALPGVRPVSAAITVVNSASSTGLGTCI